MDIKSIILVVPVALLNSSCGLVKEEDDHTGNITQKPEAPTEQPTSQEPSTEPDESPGFSE